MYFQSGKGCFKVAGWNISDKGHLYIEKVSGASIMVTDNEDKAKYIFDMLNEKAQLEEISLISFPDKLLCNTDMVPVDEQGNVLDEDEAHLAHKEVFLNLLPHQLKDSMLNEKKQEDKTKEQHTKAIKKKLQKAEIVDPSEV